MTEQEVTLEQVKEEKKPEVEDNSETIQDVIETLRPSATPINRVLEHDNDERVYIQKPLTFFGKIRFFSIVGETVDTAFQTGLTVNAILEGSPALSNRDFSSVDSLIFAISKLTRYSENFLKRCYCIWLDIPDNEWEWAMEALENLSDDEGLEIIETFLVQNQEVIQNLIRNKIPAMAKKSQEIYQGSNSQSSNNSKRTRRRTRKQ